MGKMKLVLSTNEKKKMLENHEILITIIMIFKIALKCIEIRNCADFLNINHLYWFTTV